MEFELKSTHKSVIAFRRQAGEYTGSDIAGHVSMSLRGMLT